MIAHAQSVAKKDGEWRGLIGASVNYTTGNTQTLASLVNLDIASQTLHHKTSLQGFLNHGVSKVNDQNQTTANKWGLFSQYDRDIDVDWFGFGKVGFDGDKLIDLTLRSNVAAGVGYHIIDEDKQNFDVFGGLSYTDRQYRKDQLVNGRTGRHFSNVGGILGEESTDQVNERVALKQRLELYPDFSRDKAHLAKFNGSLNVSMTQMLSLSVGWISTFNNNVPPGVKKMDTSLFTGVNVRLGD